MYFHNNSIVAMQLMPECDELKQGSFIAIGVGTWNLTAYINEDLFMAYIGNAKIFDKIWRVWK